MTLLPAIATALLAAAATAEPDAADAPSAITDAPVAITDAPAATSDGPATPELPQTQAPPPLPPPSRVWTPAPREFHVMAGYHALSVMGLEAQGVAFRIAWSARAQTLTLLAADLFVGETSTGLPLRTASLGVEIWTDPASPVRAGIGPDLGILGYQRATTGEWDTHLAPGVRGGVEVAALRIGAGALVLGGHVAGRFGPWSSFALSVGYRALPQDQATW